MRQFTIIVILSIMTSPLARAAEPTTQSSVQPSEAKAFADSEKAGTPMAFSTFYKTHANSSFIKTLTGTVRARYWFDLLDQNSSGILLTISGSDSVLITTVSEAKQLGAIRSNPAKSVKSVASNGQTFDYTRAEITSGSSFVQGEEIKPTDFDNAIVIFDAANNKVLSVDVSQAKEAKEVDIEATFRPKSDPAQTGGMKGITRSGFGGGGFGVDKNMTPSSQKIQIEWSVDETGKPSWKASFP